jgi:LEA14-like dessication related protein
MLALLVLPLLGVACSAADEAVDKVKPEAPDVTAEKADLTRISPAGLELLVELGAYNPNSIDLEARSVTARVVVDARHDLGTVEIPQEVDLPSKQKIRISVPAAVDWKDVSIVAALVALKRNIPYDIDGEVKIGVELFKVTAPFHVTGIITEEKMREALGAPPPAPLQ